MKRILLIIAAVIFTITSINAQTQRSGQGIEKVISKTCIQSNKPVTYDSRTQAKDTVFIAIKKWMYDTTTSKYTAQVADYIKTVEGYKVISEKIKPFTQPEVDALFTIVNNSITPSESYSTEFEKVLTQGLLLDTKNNLLPDGKTLYGATSGDWITKK